jgi:hypothetical protein
MATPAPTDDELDAWIVTRLNLIGVDLSVLPVSDAAAPADQTRILSSVRNLLRGSVPAISGFVTDVQENPPVLYPAEFSEWTDE